MTFEAIASELDTRHVEEKQVTQYLNGTSTTHVAYDTMHVIPADVIKIRISLSSLNGKFQTCNGYILKTAYK